MNQQHIDPFSLPETSQEEEKTNTKDDPKKPDAEQNGITYDWIFCSCGHHHQVTILPNGKRIVDTGYY